MEPIRYIDRNTREIKVEKVYFGEILKVLYGNRIGYPIAWLLSRLPFFSAAAGWWNKRTSTRTKVRPFIEQYAIDASEFQDPIDSFQSFNDFFIRKLKPESRPIAIGNEIAIIPADARYLFYPNIAAADGFLVKGEKFSLKTLLQNASLAKQYAEGTMILARLCPTDYHRYHFPVDCIPGKPQLINGPLFSVNPIALKQNINILAKNKRKLCRLQSPSYGQVLFIEVGATNVGSINDTFVPGNSYNKGDEKGYFSFGASSLILLFEPHSITLDADLIQSSSEKIEIFCQMGQKMGKTAR